MKAFYSWEHTLVYLIEIHKRDEDEVGVSLISFDCSLINCALVTTQNGSNRGTRTLNTRFKIMRKRKVKHLKIALQVTQSDALHRLV